MARTWRSTLSSSTLVLQVDVVLSSILEVEREDGVTLLEGGLLDFWVIETGLELIEEFLDVRHVFSRGAGAAG